MAIPIFETRRWGEAGLTKEAKGYRSILLTMLREDKPLTRRVLAKRAEVKETTALVYLNRCVKEGLVLRNETNTDDRQIRVEYELTAEGTFLGIAITANEGLKSGVNYDQIIERNFAIKELDSPITKFTKKAYLNMLKQKQVRQVIDSLGNIIATLYNVQSAPYWFFYVMAEILGRLQSVEEPERRELFMNSLKDSFAEMTEEEKSIVGAFLKHKFEETLYEYSIMNDDESIQSSLMKSVLDPQNIIVPFGCRECPLSKP